MPIEKIEVAYKPIFASGGTWYHKYIVYTDQNNHVYIAHARPEFDIPPFGKLLTDFGRAGSAPELYGDEGEWAEREDNDFRELILTAGREGESLEHVWNAIKTAMEQIQNEGHDYAAMGPNSNTAVDTALIRADEALDDVNIPLPERDDVDYLASSEVDYYAPGSVNQQWGIEALPVRPAEPNPPTNTPNPLLMIDLPFVESFINPPISPLVLDMDGDGIELVALSDSQAMFDLDNDNFAQHTGWVAPDDALLAIDRNGNGRIDDIDEVFGNGTVDGFTELAALDSNDDGTIDASDTRFGDLLLWRDANGNGRSEADELQSLADGGVRSIDLNATESDTTLAGHRISHTSSFTRTDGTTETIVDAWFENDRHISAYLPDDAFTLS